MIRKVLVRAIACLLVASGAIAGDIHVSVASGDDARNGDSWATSVRSLGRALVLANSATGPDTVHVAAGTYNENVLVQRGDVTLLGGYPAAGGGSRDIVTNPTIINGGGSAPALAISGASGTLVLTGVVVDGFTLRNGGPLGRAGIYGAGAGVFIEEAQAVITNNVIESNTVSGDGLMGAGLYAFRELAGPSRIERNIIRNNAAEDGVGGGAALVDFADPALGQTSFSQNEVMLNQATATPGSDTGVALAQGGGLFIWGNAPVVAANTFDSNLAHSLTNASTSGQGGAIYVLDASPRISNNVLTSNAARADLGRFGGAGGAVYAWWGSSDASGGTMTIETNEIRANVAEGGTGGEQGTGGGVALSAFGDVAPVVIDNDFIDNLSSGGGPNAGIGGGLFAYVDPSTAATLRVDGGTFDGNAALDGGGGLFLQGGSRTSLIAEDLLITNNEADYGSGVVIFGDATLRHSRIRRNTVHDPDGDLVSELQDNCRGLANPTQANADNDARGDACDTDDDGDGILDAADNCPLVANPGQGNACTGDADGDTVPDAGDNCPVVSNPTQDDATLDGTGDACEPAAFDGLETNAGGIWITGDGALSNLEITDNVGQGLLIIGLTDDPDTGPVEPDDHAAVAINHLTLVDNAAAGFILYLANGTAIRDTVVARNALSDGFDTEHMGGPSSPNVDCDNVYFYDGIASLPCTGNGNLDFVDGPPLFETGFFGDYYLAQRAAGSPADFVGVDAGSRTASTSPVSGRTTRTDAVADAGTVDLGYHYAPPPATFDDPLFESVRVAGSFASGRLDLGVTSVPGGIGTVRWYRGLLNLLQTEYSHSTPFTGQPGTPECSAPIAVTVSDAASRGNGINYYYLAVPLTAGTEGSFGRNSLLALRPRPEDSGADMVVNGCP